MKQTAVEYLIDQLLPKALTAEQYYHIEQAKAMEKEQIMKARQDIFHTGNLTAEQYYNEQYGK